MKGDHIMDRQTQTMPAPADTDLLDFGSVSEETRGRIMYPLEFGVSPTSRAEAG